MNSDRNFQIIQNKKSKKTTSIRIEILFFILFFHSNLTAEFIEAKFIPIPKQEPIIDIESDQAHKESYLKEKARKKFLKYFNQKDTILLEEAFAQAPVQIKALVSGILNDEAYAKRFKNILLTGPSGSGKSILAEAMAYKMERKCIIIDAPSLLGHYRDQAAENIREVFKKISEDEDKPILIINEINALTDGHTSEHSDTKHTAMQLWTLLDKHINDNNFLLIATTNITKKMPHQLQSRFEGRTFLIDLPSLESRRRAIEFYIERLKLEKDETCTDSYLDELAAKTNNFSKRTIEALIDVSLLLYAVNNPNISPKKVFKEYLEQAYLTLTKQKEEFWDFSEHTTDEERRHRESLAQHELHFEKSQELQISLAEWNMIYQARMKPFEKSSSATWIDAITELNKTKSIVFPNKKPASIAKTVSIIRDGVFWGKVDDVVTRFVRNDDPE